MENQPTRRPAALDRLLGHVAANLPDEPGTAPAPLPPAVVSAILRDPDSPLYPTRICVYCDDCGTQFTGEFMVSTEQTSSERLEVARAHMRTQGWQCDEGGDFCPEHKRTGEPTACAKCRTHFDPTDTRFDGRARYARTPYCRHCIDRCHESTDAFHVCVICS